MSDNTRKGWRKFICDKCNHEWEWPSRDRFSPSGENCPRCDEWVTPSATRYDPDLPTDASGNLKVPWNMLPEEISTKQDDKG